MFYKSLLQNLLQHIKHTKKMTIPLVPDLFKSPKDLRSYLLYFHVDYNGRLRVQQINLNQRMDTLLLTSGRGEERYYVKHSQILF